MPRNLDLPLIGIVAAALFLGISIWRTLIVGKDDVAPLHAAKN